MSALAASFGAGPKEQAEPRPKATPRPKKHAALPEGRDACHARARGRCEARCADDCAGQGDQAHHRLRRSQGGSDDADNLLWVCTACHNWIHAHPAVSYLRGWLIRGLGRSTALRVSS